MFSSFLSLRIFVERILILLMVFLLKPDISIAKDIQYPTNQVERPLTLPDGIGEIGLGARYIQGENSSGYIPYPLPIPRYGITDNLEFYPFGLRYRIFASNLSEFVIKGRLTGFGYSTATGTGQSTVTEIFTEFGTEGKYRVNPSFAILYRIEDYYHYRSIAEDDTDIIISLGGLHSFTEKIALEFTGSYLKLWGLNTTEGKLFKTLIYYNISSIFDIIFESSFSDLSKRKEFPYLYEYVVGQSYGIRLNKRF